MRSLLAYLDDLNRKANADELRNRMLAAHISIDDISGWIRFSDKHYLRNLIRQGEYYHALALCWRSGQRSPIHNHSGSVCGLLVLEGIATETVFETTPSGLVKPVLSRDILCGELIVAQGGDIHQVSNLQAKGCDLVTLHIYSPPLLSMDTWSLETGYVGKFRPDVVEFELGGGI